MRISSTDLIKYSVVAFAAAAAIFPEHKAISTAAFVVVWSVIAISAAMVAFFFAAGFRNGVDAVEHFREIAEEEETPLKDAAEVLAMLAVLLLNAWWVTATVYLSFEVSSLVMYKAIRLFVARDDAERKESEQRQRFQSAAQALVRRQAMGRTAGQQNVFACRKEDSFSDPLYPLNPLNPLSPFNSVHDIEDGGRHLSGHVSSSHTSHSSHDTGSYDCGSHHSSTSSAD